MNNYESQQKAIDLILQSNSNIAVDKDTKEVAKCRELNCENCLFSYRYNEHHYCNVNRIKWLVAEYAEPKVNWNEIPIDTPVLVSLDNENWSRRYFAGVNENDVAIDTYFRRIKLAEVEDEI